MLYAGQKVICIGGPGAGDYSKQFWRDWARQWRVTFPRKGRVYTVRQTRFAADGSQRIRLMEIVNPPVEFNDAETQEPWFIAAQFRPLVERPTDISILQRLLTPASQMEDA